VVLAVIGANHSRADDGRASPAPVSRADNGALVCLAQDSGASLWEAAQQADLTMPGSQADLLALGFALGARLGPNIS